MKNRVGRKSPCALALAHPAWKIAFGAWFNTWTKYETCVLEYFSHPLQFKVPCGIIETFYNELYFAL